MARRWFFVVRGSVVYKFGTKKYLEVLRAIASGETGDDLSAHEVGTGITDITSMTPDVARAKYIETIQEEAFGKK